MKEQVREFSASALEVRERLASHPGRFTPVKEPLAYLIHVAYQHKP
jgi:hypothetical protein